MKTIKELEDKKVCINRSWCNGYNSCRNDVLGLIDEKMSEADCKCCYAELKLLRKGITG